MRFAVRHETIYRYSAAVRLGAHRLRLTPRAEGVVVRRHVLNVDPAPVGRIDTVDAFGNGVTEVDFAGTTDHLRFESRFELETISPVATIADAAPSLPWAVTAADPAAVFLGDGEVDETVAAFAFALAGESGFAPAAFLERLTRTLHERTDRHIRPDGHARSAAQTLALGRGACRDVTVLFMAAVRALGMPARFVSGYQARAETPDGRRHLHAWPEVFVPGSGRLGFDPTHGLLWATATWPSPRRPIRPAPCRWKADSGATA